MTNQIGIRLRFCPAPSTDPTPAQIEHVARTIITDLRAHNQQIEPFYDGSRGSDLYQWLVTVANAAQPLLPLAQLSLIIVELINQLRQLASKPPTERQPSTSIVLRSNSVEIDIPLTSDEALLEQLLSENLPSHIDPAQIEVEVRVTPPSIEL